MGCCECQLPTYKGKKRVYVNLTEKKGKEVVCGLNLSHKHNAEFSAAMDLLMPSYGGLNLQPHAEVMAKIKEKEELLKAMKEGDRIKGVHYTVELRMLDCDEYACLDQEVFENGF